MAQVLCFQHIMHLIPLYMETCQLIELRRSEKNSGKLDSGEWKLTYFIDLNINSFLLS